ncbi:uncharacterized protein LOC124196002 [Daphnia pulex]|uniref:uncharacterized protein LOC124196002 n=1 Tax=Daphnia pulex TaxID=6669 RepID=UPI001EDEFAC1|nr:uncharacterized protein LOC124196002 [Daphnia pulex]
MDSYGEQTNLAEAVRNLANKNLQKERLLQDKSRLQSELDAVCKKLEVDRMRLRDMDYATQPCQNAGHGWNFNTRFSFANRILLNSHSLKEECSRLQVEKANLIRKIHSVDQQINSLRL